MVRKKVVIITIILILLGSYYSYFIIPLFLIGEPTPLFYIYNEDDESHFITLKICNNENMLVFQRNYTLDPKTTLKYEREIKWYLPFPSTFITWSDGEVLFFNFTMDNNVSRNIMNRAYSYESICVFLYHKEKNDSIIIPIEIKIATI